MDDFVIVFDPPLQLDNFEASSGDPGFKEYSKIRDFKAWGKTGDIRIYTDNDNSGIFFQFEFKDQAQPIPFFIAFEYITKADNESYEVKLNKLKFGTSIIEGPVQYEVNFGKSIMIMKARRLPLE